MTRNSVQALSLRYCAKPYDKCVKILIWGPGIDFEVLFYGVEESDLLTIPNEYIHQMCHRRGFTPEAGFNSSPFTVEAIR